ncbi:hypothetical protein CAPTEDRAFT_211789 [Capitella teleta]|uniref:G-protein coupled receptors family 3 profile domain-containing protein n=1 Tax=Capitella teleta TaxID=283909 RepID=R7T4L5_CAPTE|nr:hypothetical protein CAPTEDRAFT_211789 [Capitella teleta]|eukprot:ELT87766.1 hypothetical protein CAPTEDRAFT_211789 [Capitella teleta]
MIGGLFPVHKKDGARCGEIQPDRGLQRLEAMLFTIDKINADKDLLFGVRLGANIMDTCSRDVYALEQSLEYVRASLSSLDGGKYTCADNSTAEPVNVPQPVLGVVGGSYSSVSIQVANLLRLFRIPQVSYASTSSALSDKTRFEYFARTVPPDNYQAKAMADIVHHFNWTYVSTVASEGDYGELGIESFQHEARARNICVAITEKIAQTAQESDFDYIITRLLEKSTARVIVLFLRVEDASGLMSAAKRANVTGHFVWIASDGWGKEEMPVKHNSEMANGALTIDLQSSVIKEFDRYFKALRPNKNKRNPWFTEYWENVHKCNFPETKILKFSSICSGRELITPTIYKQESKIQFVFDAVYALAHALHNLFAKECGDLRGRKRRKECIRNLRVDGEVLYQQYLLNVSFDDGYGGVVGFNKQGDGLGRYNIMNYRRNRSSGRFEYEIVGDWAGGLSFDQTGSRPPIMWTGGTYDIPMSQCSLPCAVGEVKNLAQGESCCWVCTTCEDNEYVKDEYTCAACPATWWPTQDRKDCYPLVEKVISWTSIHALVPVGLALLGSVLTAFVMVAFFRNLETPIVKASGRELSFMLLSGFLVCYLMTFIILARPSPVVCAIRRFGVGFGFSITYASLLTKTNRISRIFDSASRSAKRPPFISPKSQVMIAMLLVSVQVACTCVWLFLEPPGTRHFHPFNSMEEIVLKCKCSDESFLISLVYNMFLIIVCTVYAVKTRKIPENFNESKFIGFTMYTTCIIWLAFIPIYFGTLNSFQIQLTTLCVSVSLSASVALLCLFTPKMYILLFQPEKNVRKLTMNSTTYKKSMSSSISMGTGNHGTCDNLSNYFRALGEHTPAYWSAK